MSVTTTNSRLTTYDHYRHLPDNGKQYQIIGGELFITPAPPTMHQRILLNLVRIVDPSEKAIEQFVLKENAFQPRASISSNQNLSSVVTENLTITADDVFE